MKQIACAFVLIFSGFMLDIGVWASVITDAQWYEQYFTARDVQAVGFALLAFSCCPYSRTELKVSTFFLLLWRILVFIVNITGLSEMLSWSMIYATIVLYVGWFAKSWLMREYKQSKKQPGMYKILFPVHSIWGLLQAVFLPWYSARYESRMVSDGKYIWCVDKKKFMKYNVEKLNIDKLDHVKVFFGRDMKDTEREILDGMVGMKAIPGVRDCRKFMII